MAMKLDAVVPFGRSLDEYAHMFDLTSAELSQPILGVGDGPASFNAEATQKGAKITSIDPIYTFSGDEILQRFNAVVDGIIHQVKATSEDYVWTYHQSPDHLRQNREQAIQKFLRAGSTGQSLPSTGITQAQFCRWDVCPSPLLPLFVSLFRPLRPRFSPRLNPRNVAGESRSPYFSATDIDARAIALSG
jgi:hypothetical protein